MPEVSVVIPVKNRPRLIRRAITSVQKQGLQDVEIIVANDHSTDDTASVVGELAGQDRRIRFVHVERGGGAQAARNLGWRSATSSWITFLDSDDELLDDSLEARRECARREKVAVVHSECSLLREPDPTLRLFGVPPLRGEVHLPLLRSPGPVFPGLLIHRDALVKIDGLDESILSYQEWDTSIRLARHYPFAFLPDPTFIYHCHAGETISKDRAREAIGYEQIIRKHRLDIIRLAGWRTLAGHQLRICNFYRAARRRLPALAALASCAGAGMRSLLTENPVRA